MMDGNRIREASIAPRMVAKLSERAFLDAGYRLCSKCANGVFVYDRLYQRRMPKGYHLDIQVYDFPDRTGFQPHAQFVLPGEGDPRFNVDLIVDGAWDLAAIERFFDDIFDRMACLVDT
jgi:hypothetical protein